MAERSARSCSSLQSKTVTERLLRGSRSLSRSWKRYSLRGARWFSPGATCCPWLGVGSKESQPLEHRPVHGGPTLGQMAGGEFRLGLPDAQSGPLASGRHYVHERVCQQSSLLRRPCYVGDRVDKPRARSSSERIPPESGATDGDAFATGGRLADGGLRQVALRTPLQWIRRRLSEVRV